MRPGAFSAGTEFGSDPVSWNGHFWKSTKKGMPVKRHALY